MITRQALSHWLAHQPRVQEALRLASHHLNGLGDRLRALLDLVLPPEDDRAFYVALASRREPVFRDFAVASPWAGRRRAATRRNEAA